MMEVPVVKKNLFVFLALACILALAPPAFAERHTGSLKGRITDKEGFPLPGAFLYLSSPSLLGIQNYITSETGGYAFFSLPSGTYRMTVEMPGFKTANIEDIPINTGKALALNVSLEATDIEEEITSFQAAPVLDSQSAKMTFIADGDLLRRAPLTREFSSIALLAPGVVPDEIYPDRYFAVHGSSVRANTFSLGGIDVTDPLTMAPMMSLNVDTIEEVEFETSAHAAETSPVEGGFINLVTKSGSNTFLGSLKIFHTSKSLTHPLWSDEALSENKLPPPPEEKRHWDLSLNMGGPFIQDRAWFFANVRLGLLSKDAPFLPWNDPLGTAHDAFGWRNRDIMTFFKVSSQVTPQFRAGASVYLTDRYQPVYEPFLLGTAPKESTQSLDHEKLFAFSANLNYRMNQNTFMDFRFAFSDHSTPLLLNSGGKSLPSYMDAVSGRVWGSASFNETSTGKRLKGAASITRFQNSLMGITHELKAGVEYEDASGDLSTWKDDNLIMNYFSGSPYYFGTETSPKTGKAVGKGLIAFSLAAKSKDGLILKTEMKRLGFFVQDTMNIGRRLTLHLGLRFDRSQARIPALTRGLSGNTVSIEVGQNLIVPICGLNPYDRVIFPEWDPAMTWNALSPRVGLSLDLFGDGKSILKGSFSRYSEYLNLNDIQAAAPFLPTRSHKFYWYDEDENGRVDSTDTYALFPEDYRIYQPAYFDKQISPDAKSPYMDEWTVGLNQEIIKDLSVSLEYIAKQKRNILENVLYDPVSGTEWYSTDPLAKDWWIPFSTIVPAADDYPATPVTVYYRSDSAPAVFERLQNVSQLKQKYSGFEFTIRKRMSHNWQFYGSMVLSRTTGNIGLDSRASSGFSPAAGSPNDFVNLPENSRLDLDRPVVVKLLGTYRFPMDFYLTLSFMHWRGAPWARSVTILPPDSWTEQNAALAVPVTVFLERPGTRRTDSKKTLDVRIEKEFFIWNRKRLTLSIDGLNLLGHKTALRDLNDGGFWFPDAENSSQGKRVLSSTFNKYVSLLGARKIQVGVSLEF